MRTLWQSSGHGFRAMEVLPENDNVDLYESEADQRALNERIDAIRQQLQGRQMIVGRGERPADPLAPSMYVYRPSPTPSPGSTPPTSPPALSRPGTTEGICVICHQAGAYQRPLITAACLCLVHITCALTFVENHLTSTTESSSSRMVSCPNLTMHDSRRDVFWPRILELVDVAIPISFLRGNERETLLTRVAAARERLRTMDRERRMRNLGPTARPDQRKGTA